MGSFCESWLFGLEKRKAFKKALSAATSAQFVTLCIVESVLSQSGSLVHKIMTNVGTSYAD